MPVSKSLSKITKNLKAKGKHNTIHPKGRKFAQLNKATLREGKIAAKKKSHNDRKSHELARIKFIQDVVNMDSLKEQPYFDLKQTTVFIEQFIARNDEEIKELKKKRRSNRPPTGKQLLLEQKRSLEIEEFEKGFVCPDLTDAKNVKFLRGWNQTFGGMTNMKLIRVTIKGQQGLISHIGNDVEMA